jgi:hypothetical protein
VRRLRSLFPAIVSLSIVLAGCDSFSILGQFRRISSLSLTVQKSSVQQGETISLYPTGGRAPYAFGVVAGNIFYSGTLGSVSSQQYTAGTSIGSVTIHLSDADGNTADSQVTIVPPTPTAFTAAPNPGLPANDILLTWGYPNTSLISGFEIQESPDGVTFTNLVSQPAGAISYVDPSRTPGTTYYYRMYAVSGPFQSLLTGVSGSTP